jgi:integrase
MNPPKHPHHYFTWKGRQWSIYMRSSAPLAPWYFKVDNRPQCLQTADAATAVKAAKIRLDMRAGDGRHVYTEWLEEQASRATLTVATVAAKWIAAGCPWRGGTPRPEKARATQASTLERALAWWAEKNVAAINETTMNAYLAARRAAITRPGCTGDRSAAIELITLHNCFDWAVGAGHCKADPFAARPRDRHAVTHAADLAPASDEELHRLITRIAATPAHLVHAAQLMFQALTGLRSGEPGFLRVDAQFGPQPVPGCRFQIRPDGIEREVISVARLKGGINPIVHVHPALESFLAAWLPLRAARWPGSPWYFPDPFDHDQPLIDPEDKRKRLETVLKAATTGLGLPKRNPHGMRAYYALVRSSQGVPAAIIAVELGQGTGPSLVVKRYTTAQTIFGSGHYDWQPSPESGLRPAWETFSPTLVTQPQNA